MHARLRHPLLPFLAALLVTLPWPLIRVTGHASALGNLGVVLVSGGSVLGAAFLLAWAAETAEKDVPRAFAIAVLAVLAVTPEYAVDAFYAWEAGSAPGTPASDRAAQLAVANMTGANRILIGVGWSAIALYSVYRARYTDDNAVEKREGWLADRVVLDDDISVEIIFLSIATLYAFIVPLNGVLDATDTLVLVGLYAAYIYLALKSPHRHEEQIGVPAYLQDLGRRARIPLVVALFLYSGLVILVAVEPFARGLEHLGTDVGIDPFYMIQWVAPLASESPELIVTAYLVNKARSTAAFNALISSKLNQWTLLIGTLVVVYSVSYGQYGELPLQQKQVGEIWLTAAQSYFAIAVLVDFDVSVREALLLLLLFSVQLYPPFHEYTALLAFSVVYIVLGTVLIARRTHHVRRLVRLAHERVA